MLGGLALFRDQDSGSSLVSASADILVVHKRRSFFLEAVAIPSGIVDELLSEQNVAWFSERLDARRNDNDVGNFWMLRAL